MNKVLIVNADDFGLTSGVNHAIVECHKVGVISSATLMVNTQGTDEAVQLAKENIGLGVGLHFNLTLGRPVSDASQVATLVDREGGFLSRPALLRRLRWGQVEEKDVARELNAQFERMQLLGLSPTHIDGHQHVQSFPKIFDRVASLCVAKRLPLRVPWVLKVPVRRSMSRLIKQVYLGRMLKRNLKAWQDRLQYNDGLGSIFDLGIAAEDIEAVHYGSLLDSAPAGVFELMVHPARDAAELGNLTSIGSVSEREWRILSTASVLPLIEQRGFRIKHFGNAWST